jgi:hypothetical protein
MSESSGTPGANTARGSQYLRHARKRHYPAQILWGIPRAREIFYCGNFRRPRAALRAVLSSILYPEGPLGAWPNATLGLAKQLRQLGDVRRDAPRFVLSLNLGGKVMEWFSRKTSIAGAEVPNWLIVLGAIVVIWIIYSFVH